MKKKILILILLISNYLIGQKTYKINTITWTYTTPINYIPKIDNFEKERKRGEEYLKQEANITSSTDDVILLALEKKDSSANAIFVSYKNNLTIKEHTLNGYTQLMKDLLIENCKKEYPNNKSTVIIDEMVIDNIKFNVIRQTTLFEEEGFVGTKSFYIAEIDEKEFMILLINIDEEDRKNAENSVLKSTFRAK
ncbi:hypothetical protein [Flavobacterium sp. J27]|uniref:hypothetical protein n=1 Tax=Flavobacterium sp. J27 TaxID=2060419 RepID=UPI001031A2A9|nr:hypothetical protein [Flavobacterium sp. J27]